MGVLLAGPAAPDAVRAGPGPDLLLGGVPTGCRLCCVWACPGWCRVAAPGAKPLYGPVPAARPACRRMDGRWCRIWPLTCWPWTYANVNVLSRLPPNSETGWGYLGRGEPRIPAQIHSPGV